MCRSQKYLAWHVSATRARSRPNGAPQGIPHKPDCPRHPGVLASRVPVDIQMEQIDLMRLTRCDDASYG